MPTANETYFDSALRHQVGVRRFAAGEAKRVVGLLEQADRDLVRKIRRQLEKFPRGASTTTKRFQAMLVDIRDLRKATFLQINGESRGNLFELARMEVGFEERLLGTAIPFDVSFASVDATQVRKIVTSRPFQGRLLREWYGSIRTADQANLRDALRLGMVQGESIPNIVRRIAGTRANGFRDGALSITRRNAEAVTRTAVNHVSNAAREEVFDANSDIMAAKRWTSTLDGRTSAICQARDGAMAPVAGKPLPPDSVALQPPGARPPAHVNCRSIMVAVIDDVGVVGERPFVRDTRTPGAREVDFRRLAKDQGRSVKAVREEWARENIGRVPAKTTYDQWLRRQPKGFQDEVLGPGKAKIFRKGQTLDKFVDRRGNELTIGELEEVPI